MPLASRARPTILACLVLIPTALSQSGCNRSGQQSNAAPPPPAVSVSRPVVRNDVIDWDEYVGRIDAIDSVDLRPRVSGYIDSVHFTDGSIVKQNDLLFVIDPRPYQAAFDLAKANLQNAQSQVQLAQIELERNKAALPTHAISQQDFDRALFTLRSNIAQSAAAQANLNTARLNLEWCRVVAPISGRIGRREVTPGNLVSGGAGGTATLLTNITSLDPIYCYIQADEQAVLKYRRLALEHQRVSARQTTIECFLILADGSQYPFPGHIDYISNRFDPATGTLQARGVFKNPDEVLTPGMFGRLRIAGSAPRRAVLVADQAVGTNQNQRYVLVVGPGNRVQARTVAVGDMHDGLREVTAGLNGDERIIVEGLLRARPGSVVAPAEVPMPTLRVLGSASGRTFPTTAPTTRRAAATNPTTTTAPAATTTPAAARPPGGPR